MPKPFDMDTKRAIRHALARDAYRRDMVRIADADVAGYDWLVASNNGLFAVAAGKAVLAMHGWFFGIRRYGHSIYLFENCGLRDTSVDLGRIVQVDLVAGQLVAPQVLVKGLHNNCHQLAVIDGLLCILDTANQAILRYRLDGTPVDAKYPFPVAANTDSSGGYLHINAIAKVGDRIAIMLHNGKAVPEKQSELAWLDTDWKLLSRHSIPGHCCHDIVEDEQGVLWHSGSMAGELISSDGRRAKITDRLMTRGIAITDDTIVVGKSTFGPRQLRDQLGGGITILDRQLRPLAEIALAGSPTDIVAIQAMATPR